MNKETVCAVVVTYNRKELLIECLEALENQSRSIDAIYIVDNASTDGTPGLLLEKEYILTLPPDISRDYERTYKKNQILIHYVRMFVNTGGAGGFYEGVKRAYNKGYNWFWLMDDDAFPQKYALKELSRYFNEKDVSALASVVKDCENNILKAHRGYFDLNKNVFPVKQRFLEMDEYENNSIVEIDFASFVGILVKNESIKKIGFPKKEFFIHYDDTEYSIRLRDGKKILLVNSSIIYHENAFFNENPHNRGQIKYENLWIAYFGTRNFVWSGNKYHKNKIYFYFFIIKRYSIEIVFILLFGDNKFKRMHFVTEAYLDGFRGNFDNEKPKKILYQ